MILSRTAFRWRVPLIVIAVVVLFAGCASPPDAETTRDALTEATETPVDPAESELQEMLDEIEIEPYDCTRYLVITVRGTGEPVRGQLLSPVARAIEDARPDDVEVIDLEYPATTQVQQGGTVGVHMLVRTLNQQAMVCPRQQSILLGYSQGALVIGDTLASPDVRIVGEAAGTLSTRAAKRVSSVVMYGDPRFVGTETFNAGFFNPEIDGLLARPAGALERFEERIVDFCVRRDFVCQSTTDLDEKGHVQYFDNGMQEEGADFVISRMGPVHLDGDRKLLNQD